MKPFALTTVAAAALSLASLTQAAAPAVEHPAVQRALGHLALQAGLAQRAAGVDSYEPQDLIVDAVAHRVEGHPSCAGTPSGFLPWVNAKPVVRRADGPMGRLLAQPATHAIGQQLTVMTGSPCMWRPPME